MGRFFLTVLGLASAFPVAALAQETADPWRLEAAVGGFSDYRYRGLSLSEDKPALQAGVTLSRASGLYADVYLSSIAAYGGDEEDEGSRLEATLSVGWAGSWLGLDWDAALSAYRYPGGHEVDYVEAPFQVSRSFGAATATVGYAYAPSQTALGDEDNHYGWTGIDYAPDDWPVSVSLSVGREQGAYAPDGKTDWRIGGFLPVGKLTAGLEWVDSDRDDGALVASLFANF